MKKLFCLMVSLLVMGLALGQQVVNGVFQGSPSSFMFLTPQTGNPNNNQWSASWVKPSYETSTHGYGEFTNACYTENMGIRPNPTYFSHRFVTSTSPDYCFRSCQSGNSFNRPIMAEAWDSDIRPGAYADTVIQMGMPGPNGQNTSGVYAQQILYSFVPDTNNPVLLLNFSFVTEDAAHNYTSNPGFEFAVLPHGSESNYLNLGGNYNNNPQFPYSRFWYRTPSSNGTPDPLNTPVTRPVESCPRHTSCQCQSGVDYVFTYPYTIVAFDLSNQARAGQAVDFRIRVHACNSRYHWAYCYFTAKMIPAKLKVEYCGGDSLKLNIPWGFEENENISYKWYNGTDDGNYSPFYPDDPADSRVIPGSTKYHPLLIPDPENPYYRCEVMSYTGVPFTYEATVNYYLLKPAFFAEPKSISDSVPSYKRTCDYGVVVHNQSQIGVIRPNGSGGVDTIWQDLRLNPSQCTWDFGDGTPEVHEFEPQNHVYQDTGKYAIKLHIQDFDRICTSFDTIDTVHILGKYKLVTDTLKDTVVTCESNLPYFYRPAVFGHDISNTATTWDINVAGTIRTVKFTGHNDTLVRPSTGLRDSVVPITAWNGCDSIARVKFDVLTPTVVISQVGDFCDSAQTLLVANVANVSDENEVRYEWTYLDTVLSTVDELWAISDGTYSVSIVDTATNCKASASFKIDPCVPNVFLPNCITPTKSDNEGPVQNDYFYLDQFVLRFITDLKFMVYTRNGELVWNYEGHKDADGNFMPPTPYDSSSDEMKGRLILWDGKVNGHIIDGNYIYTLWIVSGGQTYLYKGMLTVM